MIGLAYALLVFLALTALGAVLYVLSEPAVRAILEALR